MSLIDCSTGKPNARYWALNLIHDHFCPGDKLAETHISGKDISAQAFTTAKGRAVLLINKRNAKAAIKLKQAWSEGTLSVVDSAEIRADKFNGANVELAPFAVAVLW